MILVGNQRGGARDLALHLMKEENDHVQLHELRGFSSETLAGALNEAFAISRATRCRQFLFSLSLNPPPGARVKTEDFERAVEQVEEKLGLSGQPRAIVFHEKDGRRHAHAVWSRIDAENMKAVQLSFSKTKMQAVSRELYLEHGWQMPRGLTAAKPRDPRNFTLEEWQQAKRAGKDAREVKTAIQDAWAISDSQAALSHALEERGFKLARGDRRGFVALDWRGEVYALSKWAGVLTKDVRARIAQPERLPDVAEAKEQIAGEMSASIARLRHEQDAQQKRSRAQFERERDALVTKQREERQALREEQMRRAAHEAKLRQARFPKGFAGLWNRLTGEHARIKRQNENEAFETFKRDQTQRDDLIFRQLDQRRALTIRSRERLKAQRNQGEELRQDADTFQAMETDTRAQRREEFKHSRTQPEQPRNRAPRRDFDR